MKTIVSLALAALLSAASAFADQQLSTSMNVTSGWSDSVFLSGPSQSYKHDQTAPPGTSLSDSGSNSEAPYGSADGSVNLYYGSCGMTASGAALTSSSDGVLGYGGGSLSAQWISQITINSPGMEGQQATVRLTYHASGAVSGTSSSYYANASASYGYSVGDSNGNGVSFSGGWDAQSQAWNGNGSPNRTFTLDTTCTVGQPCEITHNVSWSVSAGTGEPDFGDPQDGTAQANGNLSVRGGSFVVLDPDGNLLDYTADSPSGSSQAVTYPAGTSFSTFHLTNSAADSHGSTLNLLDGLASAATQLVASFVAPPDPSQVKAVSDAVDLTGTGSDLVAVQLGYDPAAVQALGVVESALRLAWLNPDTQQWVNAVFGDIGPAVSQFFPRAYNAASDFHAGYHGVDTANHVAWAVVNHNSAFVVAMPQPYLKVRSAARLAGQTFHLDCFGAANASNRIETSPDLSAGSWTTLATVPADASGAFQYDDAQASGAKKFYRIAYP